MRHAFFPIGGLSLLFGLNPVSQAATPAPTVVAERFVAAHHPWQALETVVSADPLQAGSQFQQCAGPLEAFLPPGGRFGQRTTIGVRCVAAPGWVLYLPVTVNAFARVLVARQALAPNQPVQAAQVMQARQDIAALPFGYLTQLPTSGNWKVRQLLQAGQVLTPMDLVPDALIRRGQTVTLRIRVGAIEISQRGEALSDAPLDGRINVRNRESGRTVDGIVTADGVVDVR